jgi:hypothetical protein
MQELLAGAELRRREIAELGQRIDRAQAELARVRGDPPDPTERRFGDAGQPASVVAGRRRAPWEAKLRELSRDVAAAAEEQRLAREALIALESRLVVGRRACAIAAAEEHRACQVRLAHHDHALLGRHPDRDLIADLLDRDGPPLAGWVAEWLAGAEEAGP